MPVYDKDGNPKKIPGEMVNVQVFEVSIVDIPAVSSAEFVMFKSGEDEGSPPVLQQLLKKEGETEMPDEKLEDQISSLVDALTVLSTDLKETKEVITVTQTQVAESVASSKTLEEKIDGITETLNKPPEDPPEPKEPKEPKEPEGDEKPGDDKPSGDDDEGGDGKPEGDKPNEEPNDEAALDAQIAGVLDEIAEIASVEGVDVDALLETGGSTKQELQQLTEDVQSLS